MQGKTRTDREELYPETNRGLESLWQMRLMALLHEPVGRRGTEAWRRRWA